MAEQRLIDTSLLANFGSDGGRFRSKTGSINRGIDVYFHSFSPVDYDTQLEAYNPTTTDTQYPSNVGVLELPQLGIETSPRTAVHLRLGVEDAKHCVVYRKSINGPDGDYILRLGASEGVYARKGQEIVVARRKFLALVEDSASSGLKAIELPEGTVEIPDGVKMLLTQLETALNERVVYMLNVSDSPIKINTIDDVAIYAADRLMSSIPDDTPEETADRTRSAVLNARETLRRIASQN